MPFHTVVKRNATIPDTLKLIYSMVNIYYKSPFVVALTKALKPEGNKYDFIKRLFEYVCRNVKYQLDPPGREKVWTPQLTVKEGIGDCKKMTTLIASVLKCAGIDYVLKHVEYAGENHTHIYVIVPFPTLEKYLIVDPVNNQQWNKEVTHIRGTLILSNGHIQKTNGNMDLEMMGKKPTTKKSSWHSNWPTVHNAVAGVDDDIANVMGCPINGKEEIIESALMGYYAEDEIGRRHRRHRDHPRLKQFIQREKERRAKFVQKFKKFSPTLASMRGAFLALVRVNMFRLANKMAKNIIIDPTAIKKVWASFGGDYNILRDTVRQGAWSNVRADLEKSTNGIGSVGSEEFMDAEVQRISGMGAVQFAIPAAIALATPLVTAMIKVMANNKKDDDDPTKQDNADLAAEGIEKSGEAASSNMSGIDDSEQEMGMVWEDEIVSGDDFDYKDSMGRKRKRHRKHPKGWRKARRKARKAAKHGGGGEESPDGGSIPEGATNPDQTQEQVNLIESKGIRVNDEDLNSLAKVANYGMNKLLKGHVTKVDMNNVPVDESGTKDTPLLTLTNTSPQAGSFGLTAINSFPDFLHWFRGMMCIALALGAGLQILTDTITIGSLLFLTRGHIFNFIKKTFKFKKHGT